jgi:hypothetical protein
VALAYSFDRLAIMKHFIPGDYKDGRRKEYLEIWNIMNMKLIIMSLKKPISSIAQLPLVDIFDNLIMLLDFFGQTDTNNVMDCAAF